jgi:hypothetical protein
MLRMQAVLDTLRWLKKHETRIRQAVRDDEPLKDEQANPEGN